MPTDYTTTHITVESEPADHLITWPGWFMRDSIDWGPELSSHITPRTPHETGSAGERSQIGVAWPR